MLQDMPKIGGGNGSTTVSVTATAGTSISISDISGSNAVHVTGTFSASARIATNSKLFSISPVPTEEINMTGIFYPATGTPTTNRAIKVDTNGDVYLTGAAVDAGNTWRISILYPYQ